MKRVYWRPRKASKPLLFAIGLVALAGAIVAEHPPQGTRGGAEDLQLAAARLADRSFLAIRDERIRRGHKFLRRFDPGQTGLVGEAMSLTTSLPADLESKQTSVNPNFAAAIVDMLQRAGVRKGDRLAIGCTGSFPAFNVCLAAAVETMNLRPTMIHSVSSSQYGANHPDFLWLDMENLLYESGLISFQSDAATLGGYGDRAVGTSAEVRAALAASIERNRVQPLAVTRLAQSIDARMEFYRAASEGQPIAAYVNVGGGAASIRGSKGKAVLKPGLNQGAKTDFTGIDCVAARFAAEGVPVIHLADAVGLAREYGLPIAPLSLPAVDAGGLHTAEPNRVLASLVLLVILVTLHVCIWSDFWERCKAFACRIWPPRRIEFKGTRVLQPFGAELSV
jgi:poly-gamma-glutamate system protein